MHELFVIENDVIFSRWWSNDRNTKRENKSIVNGGVAASEIQGSLNITRETSWSVSTVKRRLAAAGLHGPVAAHKTTLLEATKQKGKAMAG